MSKRRATIAKRLVEAQHTAAMLTTFNEVDMSAVQALRARVTATDDPTIPVEAAHVTVELTDGRSFEEYVPHGRGTPGRPMSDPELDAKIGELVDFGAAFVDAGTLIAAVRGIETAGDAATLMRLTVRA